MRRTSLWIWKNWRRLGKSEPAKYTIGIGQEKMAVAPITQDAVTLAANAALRIIDEEDLAKIDLVIFGTESGIDNSKSGAVYVHDLLGIQEHARCIELKQACYGATAGIQLAKGHVALNPESRVLVLGSDISRYGIGTAGEVTQGAGAVAMIISAEPRILALENRKQLSDRRCDGFLETHLLGNGFCRR